MFEKMGGKALEGVSSDFIIQTTLDVQDTTAPQIQVQDRYDILQGDDFDLSKEIKVSDETEDVSVDVQGTIDTTTAGSYTATIIATDDAGNQTSKEVQVVVDKRRSKLLSEDCGCGFGTDRCPSRLYDVGDQFFKGRGNQLSWSSKCLFIIG